MLNPPSLEALTQTYWALQRAWNGRRTATEPNFTVLEGIEHCKVIETYSQPKRKIHSLAISTRQDFVNNQKEEKNYG